MPSVFSSVFAIMEGQLKSMEGIDEVGDICTKIVDSMDSESYRRHIFETRDSDSPFGM